MSNEYIIKEWTAMLSYVNGSYTGTLKNLAAINNIDYNRCIRMNRALNKKSDKVAYALMMNEKENASFSQEAVATELPEAELPQPPPLPTPQPQPQPQPQPVESIPLVANHIIISEGSKEEVEYVSKNEFQVYRENINATLDSIIESQKNSEKLSNILFFSIGVVGYYLCSKSGIRIHF